MTTKINGTEVVSKLSPTTSYPKQLAQWVNQPASKLRDRHLATFMAVRNDVEAALDAGFTAKTIWANMHETGRVNFSYETFLRHVKRCFGAVPARKTVSIIRAKDRTVAEPVIVAAPVMPGFIFNPVPNKEGLL